MEPRAERVANPETACLLDEDQEGRLECVVGFEPAGEQASTDAENHRSMALDQDGKRQLGGLAAIRCEALEELAVGQVAHDPDVEERFELVSQSRALVAFHWWGFSAAGMVAIADLKRASLGE